MGKDLITQQHGEILIYKNALGNTKVDVFLVDNDIWMSRVNISRLYDTSPQNISMHIKHIYADFELVEAQTSKQYLLVQPEGTHVAGRQTKYYNLAMILAIGYRVRSSVGVQFRNWASSILSEYVQKGFALNDERLKTPKKFGQDYFEELLERIRDIRSSEQRFYQKIKDIYTLSVDYDPNLKSTKDFFASVQNKMLYAISGKTAAEIITERADAAKPNMGLTSFKGSIIRRGDVIIAKNYLSADELDDLNRLVTMFLDHAEDMAKHNKVMTMSAWNMTINEFLEFKHKNILHGKGSISHEAMESKALKEYGSFHARQLLAPKEDTDANVLILPKKELDILKDS